jgi:hypothetical protein
MQLMAGRASSPKPGKWTIAGAEALLQSLHGVISARVVAKPGGEVEEIHLLTNTEVSPKQTVRNVESALLAHFDLTVDHRKVSVAQTVAQVQEPRSVAPLSEVQVVAPQAAALKSETGEPRILFIGLQVETQRTHQVRFQVELEWRGARYRGEATGADIARSRMDTVAGAALRAIESAATAHGTPGLNLTLDGVKTVDAFDHRYALVAVNAFQGRQVTPLCGTSLIEDSPDKSVILATLQATCRWVRGRA